MNSGPENPKRSLAKSLGALFALTGGLMLTSTAAANAAAANSGSAMPDGTEQLEVRVQKIQQKLGQAQGTELEVSSGDENRGAARLGSAVRVNFLILQHVRILCQFD